MAPSSQELGPPETRIGSQEADNRNISSSAMIRPVRTPSVDWFADTIV